MKKKILALLFALMAGFCLMQSGDVYADDKQVNILAEGPSSTTCGGEYFGLRAWYYGLQTSDCKIGTPNTGCNGTGRECSADEASTGVARYVWVIILNVLGDLFIIGGLVTIGFIIYGGYLYIRSGGEPTFVAKGKKTIINAVIGLIITTLANVIVKWITDIAAGTI